MGARKRMKKHKKRGVNRRLRCAKKPMCEEQKEARKKMRESQSVASKAALKTASKAASENKLVKPTTKQ